MFLCRPILPLLCVLRVVVKSTLHTSLSVFSYPKVPEGSVWIVCCELCFPRESDWDWACSSKHTQEGWGGDVRGWHWAERSG